MQAQQQPRHIIPISEARRPASPPKQPARGLAGAASPGVYHPLGRRRSLWAFPYGGEVR